MDNPSEKVIWDFLYDKIGNAYGVAGLMGNLYVESKLNPVCLQGAYARKFGMTSAEYTYAVDNGAYTNFAQDSAGYGLAQWSYWSRKEALLHFAQDTHTSVGNLNTQLEYLWSELQGYKTVLAVLKSAQFVKEASDIVVERYEKPTDQSEKAKQNRAAYGQKYYDKYAGGEPGGTGKKVITTFDKVNIRYGNGKNYGRAGRVAKGETFDLVATADNGWHAIAYKDKVLWICGDYCMVK